MSFHKTFLCHHYNQRNYHNNFQTRNLKDKFLIYIFCYLVKQYLLYHNFLQYFADNYKKVVNTKSFSDNVNKLINENKNTVSNKFMIDNMETDYIKVLTYLKNN